jgi:hypothetical protein
MPRPIKNLTNMEIDEISLVDKGANQHAMITIAKRAPEEDEMPQLYNDEGQLLDEDALEDGDIVYDQEGNAYEFSLTDEDDDDQGEYEYEGEYEDESEGELQEVGKASLGGAFGGARKAVNAFTSGAAGIKQGAGKATGLQGAAFKAGKFGRQHRTKIGIGGGLAAGGGIGYGVAKSYSEELMEELSKAFSDDDRDEIIAKALGRIEELESDQLEAVEIAKSERDLRLTREYISKAAEYNLPVDPEELGPVLYRMAETMTFDDCAVIAKCLETAGTILFEEVGFQGGGDNTDIYSQVEAAAHEEFGKAENFNSAEAINKVFEMNPDAYEEYLSEQRNR